MVKVLHLISNNSLGGAQEVVKGIVKNNENNYVYYLRYDKNDLFKEINKERVLSKKIKKNSLFRFKCLFDIYKLNKKYQFEIFHVHLGKPIIYASILKLFFPNIKIIFHEHGKIFNKDERKYISLLKFTKIFINRFIAVSKATKEELIKKAKINPNKIKVLYNFVDTKKFNRKNITWKVNKEKAKLGIKKGEFVVGFVGRLSKEKGCDILIKALPNLNFNYKVLIAGEGKEKESLKKLAKNLGVKENVIFLGYTDKPLWVYSIIDLLVVPSRNEAFGISIIEAYSLGIPVIGSNVNGIKEIMRNKNLLVNMNKIDLYKKINYLHEHIRDLSKNLSAKKYSDEKYFIEINKQYSKIIND
ncbi:MAG: glycosyltransferase [Candidatus Pacearchaeota archaeon]